MHAYTLQKPARLRFTKNNTYVAGIDAQWQADLADMQNIARQNGGTKYIFTIIDIFFKFAWAIPVYSKNAKTNHSGVRKGTYYSKPTQTTAHADRHVQGILQLELSGNDKTQQYLAL